MRQLALPILRQVLALHHAKSSYFRQVLVLSLNFTQRQRRNFLVKRYGGGHVSNLGLLIMSDFDQVSWGQVNEHRSQSTTQSIYDRRQYQTVIVCIRMTLNKKYKNASYRKRITCPRLQ